MKRICSPTLAFILLLAGCSPETVLQDDLEVLQEDLEILQDDPEEAQEDLAGLQDYLIDHPDSLVSQVSTAAAADHFVHWVASMQAENGLVESAEGTGFVSLYDNALASLLYIESGFPEKARGVLDYFDARLEEEFQASGGGFFQFRDLNGQERSRVWLGDNLWLLAAMKHYQNTYGEARYAASLGQLERWVRSLQDTDGGLWGGWESDGRQIQKVTEGMLMAYAVISGYDDFHIGILSYLKRHRWDTESKVLLAEESPGPYAHALDLHSLYALYWGGQAAPALASAERFFSEREHSLNGISVAGYCFDEDQDVVWMEGSAQMALAYRMNGWSAKYATTLTNLVKSMVPSTKDPAVFALPYTANQGSNFGAVPLWEHADKTPAISSSVWCFFALRGFNPLQIDGKSKGVML